MINRGEIFMADLGMPEGSGRGFTRPVIVIQSNEFNLSKISTIVVAVITSNLELAKAPGNVFLEKKDSGLKIDSVLKISQIINIDRD